MAQKPIVMDQLKQILQLKNDDVPIREIARRIGISRNSVRKYLARIATDVNQPTDTQIAKNAYNSQASQRDAARLEHLVQHLQNAKTELAKTGVTRQLLWQEYIAQYPEGC